MNPSAPAAHTIPGSAALHITWAGVNHRALAPNTRAAAPAVANGEPPPPPPAFATPGAVPAGPCAGGGVMGQDAVAALRGLRTLGDGTTVTLAQLSYDDAGGRAVTDVSGKPVGILATPATLQVLVAYSATHPVTLRAALAVERPLILRHRLMFEHEVAP